MSDSILEVQHLTKNFGSFRAVDDVSFHIEKGDVFGFLGPNGAGKSTTIRCILSLIKPDSGSIKIFGLDAAHQRSQIMARVGSIIEKADFYKYLSAEQNLRIFSRISGKNASTAEILRMLDIVGLSGRNKDKFKSFSQGMKQRLGIAQALLHDPELIILDEPTNGLDPQGIIDIRNLILSLKHEHNKTVLISSHQLSEIELIANRMVIINRGKSIVQGSVEELLNAQDIVARIEVSDVHKALELLKAQAYGSDLELISDTILQMRISKKHVPELNAMLVAQGIAVYSLETRRSLEDYFISLVQS